VKLPNQRDEDYSFEFSKPLQILKEHNEHSQNVETMAPVGCLSRAKRAIKLQTQKNH
jgi:hypothetical protein